MQGRLQIIATVVAALTALAACRTGTLSGAADGTDALCAYAAPEGGVEGGIADDIFAVMINLDVQAMTAGRAPVSGAEVWEMNRRQPDPPFGRASRLGVTGADGRLSVPSCYLGSEEFGFWRPQDEPVVVELFVFRDSGGAAKVRLEPETKEVLREGNLLGFAPEEWRADRLAHLDASLQGKAFPLSVTVNLPDTTR